MTAAIRAATDVGGTFTDLVYFSTDPETGAQEVVTAKSDTTPPDYEQGVVNVLRKGGVAFDEIAFLAHGTTLVVNALAERKGVKTGLVTTEGFRDSLEIARGNRPDFFNLHYEKPPPFVPRYLRREVPGRLTQTGEERRPLDLSGLPAIIDDFRADGVEAVAICLLHSYANPAHEQAVLERVRELWPEVFAVASHQISREWREYERTSTAVLSAYVQPVAERYLGRLADELERGGFGGQLYIMQSNCGVDSVDKTKEIPITMVESGPASGFWGAAELGRLIGEPNLLALDIGGTTAKCSLIEGGAREDHVRLLGRAEPPLRRLPDQVPVVDVVEIGQGGGSIAWVDDFGRLHVGPQSAGALPGPAAYGRGGDEATTTDANLALGRINPHWFCGGEIEADMEAVGRALARPGGTARRRPRRGRAGRRAHREQQHDQRAEARVGQPRLRPPRLHARRLRRRRRHARRRAGGRARHPQGRDSARADGLLGLGHADDRPPARLFRHAPDDLNEENAPALHELLAEMTRTRRSSSSRARASREEQVGFVRFGKFRYQNQEHSVEVPLPDGSIDAAAVADDRADVPRLL